MTDNKEASALIIEQVQNSPSLAKELVDFLLSDTPDLDPVTPDTPVFFNASRNKETYTYLPKDGFGVQKDGTKLHGFTYECLTNARSKDLFNEEINLAKAKSIYALANVLVAAYTDLVINGNDDMTSYYYLTTHAVDALSEEVKVAIGNYKEDGGVALGLVTELTATVSEATLSKTAILPRQNITGLKGIEALNEANIVKVYTAITPMVQTRGILLANGLDTSKCDWADSLVKTAPSLDALVRMKYDDFIKIFSSQDELPQTDSLDEVVEDELSQTYSLNEVTEIMRSPKTKQLVAHKMYAGMLGVPASAEVPDIRRQVLENDMSLEAANALEKLGHNSLNKVDDKLISHTVNALKEKYPLTSSSDDGAPLTSSSDDGAAFDDNLSFDLYLKDKFSQAKQSSLIARAEGKVNATGHKKYPTNRSGQRNIFGGLSGGLSISSTEGVVANLGGFVSGQLRSGNLGKLGANLAGKASVSGIGSLLTGGGAAAAGGTLGAVSALAGPISLALALAPLAQSLASATEKTLNEDLMMTKAERDKIAAETSKLLNDVEQLNSIVIREELTDRQSEVEDLMNKIRSRQNALEFSGLKGMELQKELENMAGGFGPTSMRALSPYPNDAALVAGVDGGRALSAVGLFVSPDLVASVPDRQFLQAPKYVNMMGPTQPFYTRRHRSTSESDSNSFISSTQNSSFSTAFSSSRSVSGNMAMSLNAIIAGGKASLSSSNQSKESANSSYAADETSEIESKISRKEAIVTEFTFMPMKSFRLQEGGLVLTRYAYYRLQRIRNVNEKDDEKKERGEKTRAKEFLRNFGSHIPFGTQTLGGVFIRSMKMLSEQEQTLSKMFSAASSQLSAISTVASNTSGSTSANIGLFGAGGRMSSSFAASAAGSSGNTVKAEKISGNGSGSQKLECRFESSVTCYGPNAATQDEMFDQLMENNATWTVIERADPDSYFAIWELIDYLGQGSVFEKECGLLKDCWEEMALTNSLMRNISLIESVMPNFAVKKKMFDFVQNLIFNLDVKAGSNPVYNENLADEFKLFVTDEVLPKLQKGDFELTFFSKMVNDPKMSCEMYPGAGYYRAGEIARELRKLDWNDFRYFSDTFRDNIIQKGKASYPLNFIRDCIDGYDIMYLGQLMEKWRPKDGDRIDNSGNRDSLRYRDSSGYRCIHHVLRFNDVQLFDLIYALHVATYTWKSGDDDDLNNHDLKLFDAFVREPAFTDHFEKVDADLKGRLVALEVVFTGKDATTSRNDATITRKARAPRMARLSSR